MPIDETLRLIYEGEPPAQDFPRAVLQAAEPIIRQSALEEFREELRDIREELEAGNIAVALIALDHLAAREGQ